MRISAGSPSTCIVKCITMGGSPGFQSPPGSQVDQARPGPPRKIQVIERIGPTIQIPFESQGTTSAFCGPGEIATGGGYVADVPLIIEASKALPDNTGWTITAHNGGSTESLSATAYAECATTVP